MNRLTDRLQLIADRINNGETMADIGTDHGLLPLYLFENEICSRVIMCDISEPSLDKARTAFAEKYDSSLNEDSCSCKLDFRIGDGLKVIEKGEVDTVVIAGMGGLLIRDILESDMDKTMSFRKFILQPRNNSGQLRYWLVQSGFRITHNLLVREGKFICEIIVCIPGEYADFILSGYGDYVTDIQSPEWDFPHELIERYPKLGREYAETKLGIEEKIKSGIMKSCNSCESDIISVEKRIEYYRKILGR